MAEKKGTRGFEIKMSKAQQMTVLEVLVTAILVGVAIVLSIWCIKYIIFNTKVISAKDDSIVAYEKTIINTGACVDQNGDGKFSTAELNACQPNDTSLEDVPNSLRAKIMTQMAVNPALESVARKNVSACYDDNNKPKDFTKLYEDATDPEKRDYYFNMQRACSALRVIPDALPSVLNQEATLASLTQLFNSANVTPESMSPTYEETATTEEEVSEEDETVSNVASYDTLPIRVLIESDSATIYRALTVIEKSIRQFDVTSATLEWSATGGLEFQADISAYYAPDAGLSEYNTTIAGDKAKKGGDK